MKAVEQFERSQMKKEVPYFRPGDTLKVDFRVREGDRERIQAYEGVCIARKGGGIHETIKVRKISYGVGVERTFFLHSPQVSQIEVLRRGHVKRAKLYYLREASGKKARIRSKKRIVMPETGTDEQAMIEQQPAATTELATEE